MTRTLLVASLLVCALCPGSSSAKPLPPVGFYVLSAGGELLAVRPDGRVVARRQLATIRTATAPSSRLAIAGERLYVLVRRDQPPDQIAVVRRRDARVLSRWSLPRDLRARALTLGGNAIFVGANRLRRQVGEAIAEDAVIVRLDFEGNVAARWNVRDGAEHDWWVAAMKASRDGKMIAISYHGGCAGEQPPLCTTGADLVDGTTGARRECAERFSGEACIAAHGLVDFVGEGLIAATGTNELLRLGLDGNELSRVDTRLEQNHLMDFAVDETRTELAAAGPCFYAGGLSIVPLAGGSARLVVKAASARARAVCGSRLAFVGERIVIARTGRATASPFGGGATIVLVDRRTGRVGRRIRARGEAVDVLANG